VTEVATWQAEAPGTPASAPGTPDRFNRIVAALVGAFVFAIYRVTLSPDVSFWDAGEFIATSHSLGIPHPPGTPLYVLMGRVFSILFSGLLGLTSPAVAVNLLSAIPSAIAAVLLYLCVVRVGKKMWNGGDQSTFHFPSIIAGVGAALFAAFADTLWINSIEAEVYAVSGMWAVFCAWLILVWADGEPKDERLLVVIAYLLALNIGVHLATYLAALAILPFALLHEKRLAIPVSFLVVLALAQDLQFFLLVVGLMLLPALQFAILPAEYARRYRATLLVAHAVAVVAFLAMIRIPEQTGILRFLEGFVPLAAFVFPWLVLPAPKKLANPFTDLGFLLALVTVLGFTCHLYLPLRSALNPAINEAQPDTWRAFWDVILRVQYRPVSVFDRQATWVFQSDDMFWRYFRQQWPPYLALLGIPGLLAHLRRSPRTFVLFGFLFLWTSAALILKMNFTDHEVRERDYFFAPGFFYYAVWMGLGLGWLYRLVLAGDPAELGRAQLPRWLARLVVARMSGVLRRAMAPVTAALCVLIAAVPLRGHWESHDRRGSFTAHDYARNMLVALPPNAVLFTNGDNDTFPLWYLQEVEGFRKDVRIINLSLLNTPWYGEQLRDEEPRVPMNYTTEQLWQLKPFRDQSRRVFLVKDQVALDIVHAVFQRRAEHPVYFAVTVDDLIGLDDFLKLEGLVFRLHPDLPRDGQKPFPMPLPADVPPQSAGDEIVDDVNLTVTRRNLEEVYSYRGFLDAEGRLDDGVYRDDNERKLVTNYAAAWARMALAYRTKGDMDESIACMERANEIAPDYDPIKSGLGSLLFEARRFDEAREFYLDRLRTHPEDIKVYIALASLAQVAEKWEESLDWSLRGLRVDPSSRDVMAGLYRAYRMLGRNGDAENVLVQWMKLYPNDTSAKHELEELRAQAKAGAGGPPAGGAQ
jgi:tetratricopeptide (TPR) repeat protein